MTISEETCRKWLQKLGWEHKPYQKDFYFDGHERADVVEERMKFLHRMEEIEKFLIYYDGKELDMEVAPELLSDQFPFVFVTHDESTFYVNDGESYYWGPQGEQPLRPKSQGASLHVSEFLCETLGRLQLSTEEKEKNKQLPLNHPNRLPYTEACVIIKPGKNRDGYWTHKNVAEQNCLPHIRFFHIPGDDVFLKIYSYQQILETQLWMDIMSKKMASNLPISSTIIPARKLSTIPIAD
ncbi:7172_t:CDS:2 [Acaulospora morrowiae]|uniref:7172_t:CDS:1 n=1 Tax=Acaulospora morrowiae TaxID=94023 RepID=A0A9N9ECB0_9GLOM|nr:7172_t:CDS:2 [Acaulospora morrowiae]